ncbi:TPA: energy-coupling factor ABC transporter substrate-binding protein [Candidatus Woesearchaeota archaeon]|nr:energy-coupling factor ABC transporter substrate-binding protein [Candidatus Woesearchaeota archaeon]
MKDYIKYGLGILVVVAIFAFSLLFNRDAAFTGTDDAGKNAILGINPDYRVWFQPLWKPKPETESMLFALQAAIGAFVIGYFIGFDRGSKKNLKKERRKKQIIN